LTILTSNELLLFQKKNQLETHSSIMQCSTKTKKEEWQGRLSWSNERKWNKINETVCHGMKVEENFHEKIENIILWPIIVLKLRQHKHLRRGWNRYAR